RPRERTGLPYATLFRSVYPCHCALCRVAGTAGIRPASQGDGGVPHCPDPGRPDFHRLFGLQRFSVAGAFGPVSERPGNGAWGWLFAGLPASLEFRIPRRYCRMTTVIAAVLLLTGLGVTFGIGLAVASRKLAVETDPRVDEIEELLPGANCGACGYPGCRRLAEAIAGGSAPVNA